MSLALGSTPPPGGREAVPKPALNGQRYGAPESDWVVWDLVLGLGSACLPVVSNPSAVINSSSNLKSLGKTPSRYTSRREVVGIKDWTSHVTTDAEIAKWSKEPDYGIALITRTARALDVDVTDPELAAAIRDAIVAKCGVQLPMRTRANSPKFLLLFEMPGEFSKRILVTARGAIEFLGSGQQCLVGGLHPSGEPYRWSGGLPNAIPKLTPEQFETLWAMLEAKFAIEPGTTSKTSTKAATLSAAVENDPVAQELIALGATVDRDSKLRIECPFSDGHTPGGDDSLVYFPRATGGYTHGNAICLHASCADRSREDFLGALGIEPPAEDFRDDFTAIAVEKRRDFRLLSADEVAALPAQRWRVKHVVPEQGLAAVFGPPGSGKSFLVLDMLAAVADGREWHGSRCYAAPVVYVCLEGEAGLAQRLQAYRNRHGADACKSMHFVTAPFRLLERGDVDALAQIILDAGGAGAVVCLDTLNRATPGADENSSQDMGRVIAAAKVLQTKLGGLVLLVHHVGKSAERGMRGHSSLLAALDTAVEVLRDGDFRTWRTAKAKDGADGGTGHPFRLEVVNLGMDEDRDPITSCVVVPGGGQRKAKRLTPAQRAALDALTEACHEHGTVDPEDGAHADAWRDAFYRRDVGDSPDAKKKAFQRARQTLMEGGFVTDAGGNVYQLADPFARSPAQTGQPGQGTSPGHCRDMSAAESGSSGTDRDTPL